MGTWHSFNNFGYTLDTVPTEVMDILRVEREKYRTGDPASRHMNNSLIGQINKEHDVSYLKNLPPVKSFLEYVLQNYINTFGVSPKPDNVINTGSNTWSIELNSMWMNIQEQGEYNPPHKHTGILSFVIWFEIPYDIKEEKSLNNSKYSNEPSNGDFFFHPINTVGNFTTIPMNVGRDKEGTICMFHADLIHSVHPFFTTKEQRVTFSGNFAYKELRSV